MFVWAYLDTIIICTPVVCGIACHLDQQYIIRIDKIAYEFHTWHHENKKCTNLYWN